MSGSFRCRGDWWARWLVLLAACAAAAQSEDGAHPVETPDAPYVPSPHSIVSRMLELAEVTASDHVIDLGSGDGRIVLTAAKVFGASGLGVEIREDLVERSRQAARREGVAERVRFVRQDLFETDIAAASLVTVYLLPETLSRLRGKLLRELAPGTRVLSHDYPIPNWNAEHFEQFEHPAKVDVTGTTRTNLYLYRVPANVEGLWRATVPAHVSGEPVHLEFVQGVTVGEGRARVGGRSLPLTDVRLDGRRLSFGLPALNAQFVADVADRHLEGTVAVAGQVGPWRATRL